MQMMFNTLLEVIKMQIEFYIWKEAELNTDEKKLKKKKRQNSHSNKHEISIVFRLMVVSWPAKTSAIEWVFS